MLNCSILYLDFDGVVADSMDGKARAFAQSLEPLGISPEDSLRIYRAEAGIGRPGIIDLAARSVLGRTLTERERHDAVARFSALERAVRPGIRLFEGVSGFLARQRQRRRLVLVTGTPAEIIGDALAHLGLKTAFDAVYSSGLGRTKDRLIRGDLADAGATPEAALFAGDSRSDMAAASAVPLRFIGIGQREFFGGSGTALVIERLVDLEAHLAPSG